MDRETVYDTKILPLLTKIVELCNTNNIPMLALFQYNDTNVATSIVEPLGENNIIFDESNYLHYESSIIIKNILSKHKGERK